MRIGGKDTVDLRGLEDDFRPDLHRAERGGRVSREIRVAGASGKDHDAALVEVAERPSADERFCHLTHLNRGDQACFGTQAFDRV